MHMPSSPPIFSFSKSSSTFIPSLSTSLEISAVATAIPDDDGENEEEDGNNSSSPWIDPNKPSATPNFREIYDGAGSSSPPESCLTLSSELAHSSSLHDWTTLIGGFLATAATGGLNNAIGLLQRFWEHNQLINFSPRDVGWIAGTTVCLSLFLPVLAGPVFDRYGHFWILILGSVLYCCGTLGMTFVSSTIADGLAFGLLFLCWGVLGGVGTGMVATATSGVVCRRFDKRRGLASGIVSGGNSVGGVVWPMILRDTLERWGWDWAMRTVGGVTVVLLTAACVLIRGTPVLRRRRRSLMMMDGAIELGMMARPGILEDELARPQGRRKKEKKRRKRLVVKNCLREGAACFKRGSFCWMTGGLAISQFVIMGVVGTLPGWGELTGFNKPLLFNLVAVMNASSGVGRVTVGAVSDYIGRFNSMVLTHCLAVVVMFGIFFNIDSVTWRFYLFSSCWGFSYGAILSMMSVLVRELCSPDQFGTYLSASHSIISLAGFLCIPLSAQMLTSYGPRIHVVFFGSLCVLSTGLMILSRWAFMHHVWRWWVKV